MGGGGGEVAVGPVEQSGWGTEGVGLDLRTV